MHPVPPPLIPFVDVLPLVQVQGTFHSLDARLESIFVPGRFGMFLHVPFHVLDFLFCLSFCLLPSLLYSSPPSQAWPCHPDRHRHSLYSCVHAACRRRGGMYRLTACFVLSSFIVFCIPSRYFQSRARHEIGVKGGHARLIRRKRKE